MVTGVQSQNNISVNVTPQHIFDVQQVTGSPNDCEDTGDKLVPVCTSGREVHPPYWSCDYLM